MPFKKKHMIHRRPVFGLCLQLRINDKHLVCPSTWNSALFRRVPNLKLFRSNRATSGIQTEVNESDLAPEPRVSRLHNLALHVLFDFVFN